MILSYVATSEWDGLGLFLVRLKKIGHSRPRPEKKNESSTKGDILGIETDRLHEGKSKPKPVSLFDLA